jgi:hypothetical protein
MMLVTYPLDTAKTRLIVDINDSNKATYRGLLNTLRKIYAQEGRIGLYKGFSTNFELILRNCGFGFSFYYQMNRMKEQNHLTPLDQLKSWIPIIIAEIYAFPCSVMRSKMQVQSTKLPPRFAPNVKFNGVCFA